MPYALPSTGWQRVALSLLDTLAGITYESVSVLFLQEWCGMFLLRPSSIRPANLSQAINNESAKETEEKIIQPEKAEGPDFGAPIPDTYDLDVLRVLVQDPFHLYIYWELRQATIDALTKVFPKEQLPEFQTVLRLIELDEGYESFFNVGRIGSYWMAVFPGKRYKFEVGVRSPRRGYIKLVSSNEADTPRGTIAMDRDPNPRFRIGGNRFVQVLEASGFHQSDILHLALQGGEDSGEGWRQVFSTLPEGVQSTIERASTGAPIDESDIDQLPIILREALQRIRDRAGGKFASMALMHYLPELLRWLASQRESDEGFLTPVPGAPRFMIGSSEIKQVPTTLFERISSINRPSSPTGKPGKPEGKR